MAQPCTMSPEQLSALREKVIIVTGASSGIGWATFKFFAENGAIIVNADLRPPVTPVTNVEYARCNVTNWEDLLSIFEQTMDKYKRIDVLVANAGIGEVEDLFLDHVDETTGKLKEPNHAVVKVNLLGTLNCVKLAVHFMQRNAHHAHGSIVMISSTAGILGEARLPAYSATKHAVVGLMRSLRPNIRQLGISINVIAPYMTESALMSSDMRSKLLEIGVTINKPESVAAAIGIIATGGANGKTIYVAGNAMIEIEGALSRLETQWLGQTNSKMFRMAEGMNLFTSQSGL